MERLTRLSLAHPVAMLLVLAAVTAWAVVGVGRLTTVVGYRGALSQDHEAIARLDRFIADFGGGLPVAAVWSCDEPTVCSTVFDEPALLMALEVERALSSHPLIRRVDSPATTPLLVPSKEGFAVRRLVEDGEVARDRATVAERALDDPFWRGNLVSPDGKVGAIVLQLTSSDSETTVAVVPALRAALRPPEERGFRFHLVGDPVDFAVAGGELEKETPRIVPVMVGLVAATLYWLFRSWRVVLAALATTGIALLWSMGTMGWLGWAQSEVTQALPPQVLVIGVCDTIHVLGVYAIRRRGRPSDSIADRSGTLIRVTKDVGGACSITAVTTALGFLSFSTTGFDLFSRFGVIAAVGAASALLLTFSLLPILLTRIPSRGIRAQRASDAWHHAIEFVVLACRRRGRVIAGSAGVLACVGVFGLSRLQIDVDERALFGSESQVVQWAEFVEDRLRKTDTLEVAIQLPAAVTAVDPIAMQTLADVAGHLSTLEGFGRVRSLLEPVGRLHRALHDDDPEFERPAESAAGNAQLLMALRLESGGRIDEWVTPDLRHVRLSVEADSAPQIRRGEMLATVRSYLDARLPDGFRYELTGPFALYYDFVDEIQRSQVSAFAAAGVGILAVFVLFLWWTGSRIVEAIAFAALGMLPNVLPVVCTLGAMGLWGLPLDVGTAMVAAIVLGIATDDSVHVVSHFRDECHKGAPAPEAMARTLRHVGRSVISTAVALSLGFFALTLSSWQSIASFGLLSGIAILAALVAELFLLPSLVMGWAGIRPPAARPVVSHRVTRAGRQTIAVVALLAFGGVLAVVGRHELADGEQRRLACWVFPNGYVPLAGTLEPDCPLRPHDRVELLTAGDRSWRASRPAEVGLALAAAGDVIRARVSRDGTPRWVAIPVLRETEYVRAQRLLVAAISGLGAVGGALLILGYSSAPAAAPLSVLYVCLAVIATFILSGVSHEISPVPYLVAAGFAPAAAAHVLLGFPHRRLLVARIPGIPRALYLAGLVNAVLLTYGYVRYPIVWALTEWLTLSTTVCLLGTFLVASYLARSSVHSMLERERSSAALGGTVAILAAGIGAAAILPSIAPASVPWLAAAFLLAVPSPIGFAFARFQLNDLRPHLRQIAVGGLARVVFVGGLSALLLAIAKRSQEAIEAEPLGVLATFGALVFATTFLAERAWRLMRRLLPSVDARLRWMESHHAKRASELQSADQAAELAVDTLARGLDATAVSIFVPSDGAWVVAAWRGAPAIIEVPLAASAVAAWSDREAPIHFALEEGNEGRVAERLRERGVELLVPFRSGGRLAALGFICEAENGLPYTFQEIAFARAVASRAATAIQNGRLAEDLVRAERFAAVGRVAAGLAHDVGKPMSVIHARAQLMSEADGYPAKVREDARSVAALADEALEAIERLFLESRRGSGSRATARDLVSVVERAVSVVSALHGKDRIKLDLEPALPKVREGAELARVLTNLLDNALLASDGAAIELSAFVREGRIWIEVTDRGCGMDEETLCRAFEPFFSTRESEGGRGIGLSASRALVERMNGCLLLASNPGEGTRASVSLPLEELPC